MAENEFLIRPVAETDHAEWLRLRQALWDGSTEEDHKAEMVDIIENPVDQFVAVADVGDGYLAGFLEASIRSNVEYCRTGNVGYLEGWFVEPSYRQQGIGAKLVMFAEEWARQKGSTEMASDAEIENLVSIQAHKNLGYKETARLVHLKKEPT